MLGSGTAHQVRPAGFSVVDAVVLEHGRPLKVKIGPIKVRCQSATGPSRGVERPYLSVDTTYVTARGTEHILSVAAIVAVGVNSDGHRDVLGLQVRRRSEAEPFSTEFLRSLNRSGLHAFKFVILRPPRTRHDAGVQRLPVHLPASRGPLHEERAGARRPDTASRSQRGHRHRDPGVSRRSAAATGAKTAAGREPPCANSG